MPSNYGSKKQYGRQKTYGKAVKSHLNGWFGRSLWTEIETSNSATGVNTKASESQSLSAKEAVCAKEDRASSNDSDSSSSDSEVVAPKTASAKGSGSNVDTVSAQFSGLGISEDTHLAVLVEGRTSIVIAQDLHTQPSLSSLRESSDKENEAIAMESTASSTPRKDREPEPVPFPETIPRSVLGERESLSVKESPPRKRGLRKRISTGTAVSSPLRNESFVGKDSVSQDAWEDPIKVWEDDAQDIVFVEGGPFQVVVESNGGTVRQIRSKMEECDEEPFRAPSPDQLETLVEDDDISGEVLCIEPPPTPAIMESPVPASPVQATGSPMKPSTEEDSDNSSLSELSDSTEQLHSSQVTEDSILSETDQLLQLCSEMKVIHFTDYIDAQLEESSIHKLGEASYSEVFLQSRPDSDTTTVLKIIPFGKEEQCEVKSIVQEVRITKAMAGIEGFIGFRGAYVVQGYFPEALLEEWDFYDDERGSENERPDFYEEDQLFAIIMLENGGTDLEHTQLGGWEEAADVFWQVAFALARGEKEREFEHRDLHFGNIVIRQRSPEENAAQKSPEALLEGLSLENGNGPKPLSLLKVALIDYTLSRAYCGDLSGGDDIEFMPLDDAALFSGKGDYQFDIYRFMRNHVASGLVPPEEECIDWNIYAPRTNVFWLHYLINVLLTKMGIPRPAARGRNAASEREKECFRQLETVGKTIDPRKKRFGKAPTMESSQQLVEWAIDEGIIAKRS